MRYLATDLETTGLDPETSVIIEAAFVLEDTDHPEVPVDELPYLRALIIRSEPFPITTYCAKLHKKLWEEMSSCDHELWERRHVRIVPTTYLGSDESLGPVVYQWLSDMNLQPNRITQTIKMNFAGKNFASFDARFLEKVKFFESVPMRHRVIDPAILFWQPTDDKLPDTDECLKRAGLKLQTDHTALADARNVIRLVRAAHPVDESIPFA